MTEGLGDRSGWRRQARLGLAIGTILAGSVVFASGAAKLGADALGEVGLSPGVAIEVAVAGAAMVPFVIVLAVLATVAAPRRSQGYAVGGGTLMIGGIIVALRSSTPLADPAVIGLYAGGVAVLGGALVTGVVDSAASATERDRQTVEYVDSRRTDHATPADGGEEDDDLEFLLDDEE